MIKTIIFDWDGTLHNTEGLYCYSFRKNFADMVDAGLCEHREFTNTEIKKYLGMNPMECWDAFMPELSLDKRIYYSKRIGNYLSEGILNGDAVMFEGAFDVLRELKDKGYKLIFLSNCDRIYMSTHRKYWGLDKYFDEMMCSEDHNYEPKEVIFKDIAAKYPGPYLMIGDRDSDLKVAENSKGPTIGCTYGFPAPGELKNATLLARDVKEIPELVEKLNKDY